jgi:hypothetical protein
LATKERPSIGPTCRLASIATPAPSPAKQTKSLQPSPPAYHDQRG